MKKTLFLILLAAFVLGLAACGGTAAPPLAATGQVTMVFIYTTP